MGRGGGKKERMGGQCIELMAPMRMIITGICLLIRRIEAKVAAFKLWKREIATAIKSPDRIKWKRRMRPQIAVITPLK